MTTVRRGPPEPDPIEELRDEVESLTSEVTNLTSTIERNHHELMDALKGILRELELKSDRD